MKRGIMKRLITLIITQIMVFYFGNSLTPINVNLTDTDIFYVGEKFSQVIEESETDDFTYEIVDDQGNTVTIDQVQLDREYTLKITAYKGKKTTDIEKKVIFKDNKAPRIQAEAEYTVPYNETLTYDYDDMILIDDNYDSFVTVNYEEIGKEEMGKVGTYTLNVTAKDSSGNTSVRNGIQIHVIDDEAPTITIGSLSTNRDYSLGVLRRQIKASDAVDGAVDVVLEKELGEYANGDYDVIARATDAAGNTAQTSFKLHVTDVNTTVYTPVTAPNATAQAIVDEAFRLLGTYSDCTSLVENALNAASLTGRSYSNGWSSLYNETIYRNGTVTDDPQPGDIIYYAHNSSNTSSHVAVYIGNGMAIHGGWDGYTVAIFSAYVNGASDPVFVRYANE